LDKRTLDKRTLDKRTLDKRTLDKRTLDKRNLGNGGRDRDRTCDPYDVNIGAPIEPVEK